MSAYNKVESQMIKEDAVMAARKSPNKKNPFTHPEAKIIWAEANREMRNFIKIEKDGGKSVSDSVKDHERPA